jgi:hypothetical protein
MAKEIAVRKGEKPLLVMDNTGPYRELWMFNPVQGVFLCFDRESRLPNMIIYEPHDAGWRTYEMQGKWQGQPLTDPSTIKLLNEMREVVNKWAAAGDIRQSDRGAPGCQGFLSSFQSTSLPNTV